MRRHTISASHHHSGALCVWVPSACATMRSCACENNCLNDVSKRLFLCSYAAMFSNVCEQQASKAEHSTAQHSSKANQSMGLVVAKATQQPNQKLQRILPLVVCSMRTSGLCAGASTETSRIYVRVDRVTHVFLCSSGQQQQHYGRRTSGRCVHAVFSPIALASNTATFSLVSLLRRCVSEIRVHSFLFVRRGRSLLAKWRTLHRVLLHTTQAAAAAATSECEKY